MAGLVTATPKAVPFSVIVSTLVFGSVFLLAGGGNDQRRPTGRAELVSYQPLSADGEICPLPEIAGTTMYADDPVAAGQVAAGTERARTSIHVDRSPARYVKDPWPAWSAIAVNPEHDMVVMTDENMHRIVEFSRLDNTPQGTAITEPRRTIEGTNTQTEMLCGVYIDPKTLEVYVTNNDTVNWMPVFSREARGNVAPDRALATPHRTWGIAADEVRQEMYMTIQSPPAVVVYRKTAIGAEAPLRILEGDATELADPHGIAIDTKNDVVFVTNHGHRDFYGGPAISTMKGTWDEWIRSNGFPVQTGLRSFPRQSRPDLGGRFDLPSIAVYARGASGNAPPLRVIKGPKTQLNWPGHVVIHEDRGEIFVANDADDSILVFRASDRGDVAPIRVIKGPRSGLKNPSGIALDRTHGELWVANMGHYAATVYSITANGDAPPLRTIRSGPVGRVGLMIGNPGAVGYDTKRQEILVPN
jgi:DNA-binding beta-propeller fold protein YncE